MTFRKKLMMRNASWHFRSCSQQPSITLTGGAGLGPAQKAGRRWPELVLPRGSRTWPLAPFQDCRQSQTGTGRGSSRATATFRVCWEVGKGR